MIKTLRKYILYATIKNVLIYSLFCIKIRSYCDTKITKSLVIDNAKRFYRTKSYQKLETQKNLRCNNCKKKASLLRFVIKKIYIYSENKRQKAKSKQKPLAFRNAFAQAYNK